MNNIYCLGDLLCLCLQSKWKYNSVPPEEPLYIWPIPREVLWIRGDSSVFPFQTNYYFCIQDITQAIPFMTCGTLEQLKKIYKVKEVGDKRQIQNDPRNAEEPPESTAVSDRRRNNPFCSGKHK